jgi:hypothetical protein
MKQFILAFSIILNEFHSIGLIEKQCHIDVFFIVFPTEKVRRYLVFSLYHYLMCVRSYLTRTSIVTNRSNKHLKTSVNRNELPLSSIPTHDELDDIIR